MDSMEEIVSLTVAGTVSMMKFVTNKMEHVDPVPKVIMERNVIQVWLQSLYKISFFNRIKAKSLISAQELTKALLRNHYQPI